MMRCGMPHYRHTQPCYYSTIDGPGAFFTSVDPPGVMLRHKVTAHYTTQQNTHALLTSLSELKHTHTEYRQQGLISNGKLIFCDNLLSRNKITNNCQLIAMPIFPFMIIYVHNSMLIFFTNTSWLDFVCSISPPYFLQVCIPSF